jgi:hypothetical protein
VYRSSAPFNLRLVKAIGIHFPFAPIYGRTAPTPYPLLSVINKFSSQRSGDINIVGELKQPLTQARLHSVPCPPFLELWHVYRQVIYLFLFHCLSTQHIAQQFSSLSEVLRNISEMDRQIEKT